MSLSAFNPGNEYLPPSGERLHAGIMHRPEGVSATAWVEARQEDRWQMIDTHVAGLGLDVTPSPIATLHALADRNSYLREVDIEVSWGHERDGIFALKQAGHKEAYRQAVADLPPEDLVAYQRWERICEDLIAEQSAAATVAEPGAIPQPEQPITTPDQAPSPAAKPRPTRHIFSTLIRRWRLGGKAGWLRPAFRSLGL